MSIQKKSLIDHRKTLLNRINTPPKFTEFVDNCVKNDSETCKNSFHKIMVHNWFETPEELFSAINDFTEGPPFIPIKFTNGVGICSFYTNDLNIILKALTNDFLFPWKRCMYTFDIMFNDKTCEELFNATLNLDDIVESIVSNRFTPELELNLSDFCNDQAFAAKDIYFYRLTLLATYNSLMVRMGRDTRILNLSNNKLSEIPFDILNFFIKGDLKELNLSGNNLSSIEDVTRVTSKLEKLWLEGNPLCESASQQVYLKYVTTRFPNIRELDGLAINEHGIKYPFWKNFMPTTLGSKTHSIVDKFLTLYFSHYDSVPRTSVEQFYDENAVFTMNPTFTEQEERLASHYCRHASIVNKGFKKQPGGYIYNGRREIGNVLAGFPPVQHDPTTFTVDILRHNRTSLIVVIDGIYKESYYGPQKDQLFQFRRVFIISPYSLIRGKAYLIKNESFSVSFPTKEMIDISFKNPIRNLNSLCLLNPTEKHCSTIIEVFQHVTKLKKPEIKERLIASNWDIKIALQRFSDDLRSNSAALNRFIQNGTVDCEID